MNGTLGFQKFGLLSSDRHLYICWNCFVCRMGGACGV